MQRAAQALEKRLCKHLSGHKHQLQYLQLMSGSRELQGEEWDGMSDEKVSHRCIHPC